MSGAKKLADEAIQAEPWAASGYAMRALVEEQSGALEEARNDLGEAVEREPTNWRHFLQLAHLEAAAGDETARDEALVSARELAPRSPYLVEGSPYLVELKRLLNARKR